MNYLKIFMGIFLVLSASRFIPHPPNFTSLLALSFYIPAILGARYIPALIISFLITDYFIGFHSIVAFTWGSVIIIGLISKYFIKNITTRISGALMGALLFFLIKKVEKVGWKYTRDRTASKTENAACASGIHTLHAPPRSNYSPGAGKMQGACAAMPNSRHQSL